MQTADFIDVDAFSHELNAPLSVLLAQLELMGYFLDDKARLRDMMAVASQNAFRLARRVGNLLDMMRIGAGCSQLNLSDVEVFSFVREICACAEGYARAKSIALVCEAPRHAKTMPVDADKLERVLFNLLSNAIRFSGENGAIRVRAEDGGEDGIVLSVEDTGAGIPRDRLRAIMNPSAEPAPGGRPKGAGIGLALAKAFVEMAGGRMTAVSRPGEGSRFTVSLPIVKRAEAAAIRVYGLSPAKRARIELSDLN